MSSAILKFPVLNHIAIVMPVYNDWDAAQRLLPLIDKALVSTSCRAQVLLIDDASTAEPSEQWPGGFARIDGVSILRLRRNLGHQRAIAIGLVHIYQTLLKIDALVVMDADGEDRPEDIPALLDAFVAGNGREVVFAARSKRMEGLAFTLSYHAYRIVHKALTGISVRVGNFSVIPIESLGRLMVVSELWNHYAAAVFRSRIPYTSVPIPRGTRIADQVPHEFRFAAGAWLGRDFCIQRHRGRATAGAHRLCHRDGGVTHRRGCRRPSAHGSRDPGLGYIRHRSPVDHSGAGSGGRDCIGVHYCQWTDRDWISSHP